MKYIRCFIGLVLVLSVILIAGCTKRNTDRTTQQTTTEQVQVQQAEFTALIRIMDRLQNQIELQDISTGRSHTFRYHGGVDISNKYGDIMAVSQLDVGMIVDVKCDEKWESLISIQVSPDAVCYEDVTNMQLDLTDKLVQVADITLNFAESLLVYDGTELVSADSLDDQDQVDLWEYEGRLYSVIVKLGHGYLTFTHYDTYEGGMIEVGDVIVPVTKDMKLTVREGEYQMRLTKGTHVGTRYVTVTRNEEQNIDLIGMQIAPDPTGAVKIEVTPKDCNPQITIDGVLYQAGEEIELVYGRHVLRIKAEGYEDYAVYLDVEQSYKRYQIEMQSEGGSGATQSDTQSTTQSQNQDMQGTTTSDITSHKITIQAPSGAKLYVDGEYVGETPCSFTKTAGSHIITLTRTGCVAASYTITAVDNGQDDTYSYDELATFGSTLDE